MASLWSYFFLFCLLICAVMFQQVRGFMSTNLPRLRRASALLAAKKYCVNVNLYVKPERREEFLHVIRINAQGTRTQVSHTFPLLFALFRDVTTVSHTLIVPLPHMLIGASQCRLYLGRVCE